MDLPIVLIKIAGTFLLLWTLYAIYRHIRDKRSAMKVKKYAINRHVHNKSSAMKTE